MSQPRVHKVEVVVDGRVHAVLYAHDFFIVADENDLELHASVEPIPTKGTRQQ